MATSVSWNGLSYSVPGTGDQSWSGTLGVDGLLISLAQNGFQKTGGLFTLSADVDFGATNGPTAVYFKSRSSNIAQSGIVRLANGDTIAFRNVANNADLPLSVNGSNQLLFNGNQLLASGGALTASRGVVTDGSGNLTTNAVTATEMGYVSGVTSAIQTQINTKISASSSDTLTNKILTGNTAVNLISGSGTLTLNTSGTVTLPNATDTLVGKATTDTLTNKTLTTPQINGLQLATSAVKTANYTATATDDVILCDTNSVGAFTVTLPAANAGKKRFTIRKTTSDFNVLTVSRAGSDTITDVASSLTTTTLNTQGETLTLQSDGTSVWYVIQRQVPSNWTAYTPSFTGSVSNPNLGSTGATTGYWRRIGDSIEAMIDIISGGTGITAGSGNYLVSIPSGLTINSSKVPASGGNSFRNVFGSGNLNQSAVVFEGLIPCYNDTSTILFYQISGTGQGSPVANNSPNANWLTTAGNGFSGRFTVPISGWNG